MKESCSSCTLAFLLTEKGRSHHVTYTSFSHPGQWLSDLYRQGTILKAPHLEFVKSCRFGGTHKEERAMPAWELSTCLAHKGAFPGVLDSKNPKRWYRHYRGYFLEYTWGKKLFMPQHCTMHSQVTCKHRRLPKAPCSHTDYASGKIALLFHASKQKNLKAGEKALQMQGNIIVVTLNNKSKIPTT